MTKWAVLTKDAVTPSKEAETCPFHLWPENQQDESRNNQ